MTQEPAHEPQVPYGPPQVVGTGLDDGLPAIVLPTPTTVARLADPPRPVPFAYLLATFDLSWIELFSVVMLVAAPIALYIFVPATLPVALLVGASAAFAFRAWRLDRRTGLLAHGRVATVTGVSTVGSRFSTSYSNVRLRGAVGWSADTVWYSGGGRTTDVAYTLDGVSGVLRLRGLPYEGGVVLADPRRPGRALCVSQFPYDLTPTSDGQWPGRLTPACWAGIVVTLVLELSLVAVALFVVLG